MSTCKDESDNYLNRFFANKSENAQTVVLAYGPYMN